MRKVQHYNWIRLLSLLLTITVTAMSVPPVVAQADEPLEVFAETHSTDELRAEILRRITAAQIAVDSNAANNTMAPEPTPSEDLRLLLPSERLRNSIGYDDDFRNCYRNAMSDCRHDYQAETQLGTAAAIAAAIGCGFVTATVGIIACGAGAIAIQGFSHSAAGHRRRSCEGRGIDGCEHQFPFEMPRR